MGNCKIIQIYYNEATRNNCIHECEPFYNPKLTPFFENDVISAFGSLGMPAQYEYFGVLSHVFFHKNVVNPETIFSNLGEADVLTFFQGHKTPNVNVLAENYHPGFLRALEILVDAINYDVDIRERTRMICYQNAFIARGYIYQDYIETLLKPAIKVMENENYLELHKIIWQDAKYYRSKNDPKIRELLEREIGVAFYPYHTFICERLFSLYMQKNKHITFKHLC